MAGRVGGRDAARSERIGKYVSALGLLVLLTFPLFIRFGGPGIIGGPETSSQRVGGQTLPVGWLVAAIVGAWLLYRGRPLLRDRVERWIAGFAALAFAIFVVGEVMRPGVYNALYFAQTLLPLGAYFAIDRARPAADRAIPIVFVTMLAFSGLLLLNSALARGAETFASPLENRIGPLNIYQANDYVPFVMACAYLLTLGYLVARDRLTVWPMAGLALLHLVISASYARGALAVLYVGVFVLVAITVRRHLGSLARGLAVVVLGTYLSIAAGTIGIERLTALLGAAFANAGPLFEAAVATVGAEVTAERLPGAPVAGASDDRINALTNMLGGEYSTRERISNSFIALRYVRDHPWVGGAFAPIPASEFRPPATLAPTALFPAHNQYLDMALRGGLPLLAAYLCLMWVTLRRARRGMADIDQERRAVAVAVLSVLVPTLIVGNLYQSNFVQPFAAAFLWAMVGLVPPERYGTGGA